MRKALIVGIDYYTKVKALTGCVKDAVAIQKMFEQNADGSLNFTTPRLLTGTGPDEQVANATLRRAVRELFSEDPEIALFYFSGHGNAGDAGGFLCGSDCESFEDGLSLAELMMLSNRSAAKNKVIILDSCRSGIIASRADSPSLAEIKEGTTILTASTQLQAARELPGIGGVFTSLLVDALEGAAANLVGDVTPGGVYAHIDRSLGPWGQRPVFKTNVKSFVVLRKAAPSISIEDLRRLKALFPTPDHQLSLDPSFEPERFEEQKRSGIPAPNPVNTEIFALLQRCVKANLVRPVGTTHMWHAAMERKSCELTRLGQHYRYLAVNGLL